MSDAEEKVPTGGELTLFEAVGRMWPDLLLLCRSSPVGDVRRDLIGAWQRPQQAVSAGCPTQSRWRWTRSMIVLGADTHKRSHTIAAVSAATGELMGEQTVQVGAKGFAALVVWARGLGSERVWAIEDCRHVSGSFERFLIERGERVLRVTTQADGRLASPRSRAREVRQHRRDRGRAGGAARRPGCSAGRAAGGTRTRSAAARGPSRAARAPTRRAQQHAAVASARSLARTATAGQLAVLRQLGPARRAAARAR